MKSKSIFVALLTAALAVHAAPISESTVTDIIKDVSVVDAITKDAAPASVSALVKAPNFVRTGPESRAELTASDKTVTRVGANSVFAFEPESRAIRLEKGSVLFHSPKGKGGGVIKSGGASAAVLGTTVICAKGADGTFKTVLLEGEVKVTLANGQSVTLHDGQMVIVAADGNSFSEIYDINLETLTGGSLLVNGFSHPLDSAPLIAEAIRKQKDKLARGGNTGGGASNTNQLDGVTLQTFVPPTFENRQAETANDPIGKPIIPVDRVLGQP
ncbi:MAG: hypothetical protein RL380_1026 [Verrucomicrobiota bacterium]|jgi:hypothetical protein